MIYIDNAGTGCCIGKPIVVAYREETNESVVGVIETGISASQLGLELIMKLNPDKSEKIFICPWDKFNQLSKQLSKDGYNVERSKIGGNAQDFIENAFLEQLYDLGLSRSVKLQNRDYKQFHNDIIDDIFKNPDLLKHLRREYNTSPAMNVVIRKISRLTGEFPHLYQMMNF